MTVKQDPSDFDAVEMFVRFRDGTIHRWEDDAATVAWDEYEGALECHIGDRCIGSEGAEVRAAVKPQTVTKPLRRVTVMRGRHYSDAECDYIERHHDVKVGYNGSVELRVCLPPEVRHDDMVREPWHMNGMDCNYRIVVEAVPVESDK